MAFDYAWAACYLRRCVEIMKPFVRLTRVDKLYRSPVSLLKPWERRPRITALRGVDLEVAAGEVVCLLGPNGAGKTTLLKIVAGAVIADGGGVDVDAGSVGFVAGGERSFYWRLSGAENLRFFAVLFGLKREEVSPRVAAALERVGLGARAADPVRAYSGGMRQRLAFARALLTDPELLLVDELAGELDYPTTLELARFIHDDLVKAEGRGALVATHQLWLARMIADRVVILLDGRVVASGPPREVLGAPAARYGAKMPRADAAAVSALGRHVANVKVERGAEADFVYFDEPASAADLSVAFAVLAEAGASPAIRVPETTESTYLALLRGGGGD
jgi:ABC-2 type transport system ATP-binding protein